MQYVKPKDKYMFLKKVLALVGRFFFPLEFEVHMEKNSLSESRRFKPVIEKEFLHSYIRILKTIGRLFNEILLCPSFIELQTQLFVLLRRMYYLWGEPVRNPLFTTYCSSYAASSTSVFTLSTNRTSSKPRSSATKL